MACYLKISLNWVGRKMLKSVAERARWAVAAMFAANGFTMGIWATQIPLILPRHNITESTLGLLIVVLGLGATGAMLFAGKLIAAFGARRVLSAFSLCLIPVMPAVVLAPNVFAIAVAMAIFGAMAGCMDVSMNAQAVAIERKIGRAIMSSSHGFWSLGGFFGGTAGSFALAQMGAVQQAFLAAGMTAVLVLGAMPFLLPDVRAAKPVTENGPEQKTLLIPRNAGLWLLGAMVLCAMVPEGAVMDWAAIYLGKDLGADLVRAGLAFGFFAGAMAVMRFAGDAVRNRLGAVTTLRLSGIIGAAGLMGGALAPVDWIAIASFALAGIGIANMVPIIFSAAGNHADVPSGTAISTVTMVGYAGILFAPASIGYVAEHIGYRSTYAILALSLLGVASLAGRVAAADQLHIDSAVEGDRGCEAA